MGRLTAALAIATILCAASARAAERKVGPAELASALSQAKPADALRLASGVYRGNFTVSVPSLRISGDPGAVLDGGGTGMTLTIVADGIEVEGLTVRGSGSDLTTNDAAILIREAHHVTIRRCRVETSAFGIYLRGGGDHLIAENDVRGAPALARSRRGNGIHLWHTERNQVLDNKLRDVRDGLYLSFAHHNLIRGNHAAGVRFGIHYMYSDDNTLAGNRIRDCLGGAALMFAKRNLLLDNQAVGNKRFGILLLSLDNSRFVDNLVADNDRGFVLMNSVSDRFEGNRIAQNAVGAFITSGSEGNVFAANVFDGNLVQAYVNHSGINGWSEHGRGNFWSDYVGFDLNGDGVGEAPYRLQTATSALMATRPQARWFMMSPALAMLDWFQSRAVAPADAYLDTAPLVAHATR